MGNDNQILESALISGMESELSSTQLIPSAYFKTKSSRCYYQTTFAFDFMKTIVDGDGKGQTWTSFPFRLISQTSTWQASGELQPYNGLSLLFHSQLLVSAFMSLT
jgi:hypothetical protein